MPIASAVNNLFAQATVAIEPNVRAEHRELAVIKTDAAITSLPSRTLIERVATLAAGG